MLTTETIDRIIRFRADGLPVTSVYAGVPDIAPRVDSLMHQIRPPAEPRAARLSVRADMERIRTDVAHDRWDPGTVAVFACSGADFFETVRLPRRIRDRVVVDATPWIRPLLALLDEYHRTCVATVDGSTARLWELYQDELRELGHLRDNASSKASEDEVTSPNRANELFRRHYRRVAQRLDELFRDNRFDVVVLGGREHELPVFIDHLPRPLRERVIGTFPVDAGNATAGDIKENAAAIVERYERAEERKLLAEALEKSAMGGLATVGLDRCLWAGSIAAIETLLVQDGAVVPGFVCDRDGYLTLSEGDCVLCGRPLREVPDVLDELVERVIDDGGSIEHVGADTVLKEHLTAAFIRFPLPS
jgi:peptide chain release factor subunit 1